MRNEKIAQELDRLAVEWSETRKFPEKAAYANRLRTTIMERTMEYYSLISLETDNNENISKSITERYDAVIDTLLKVLETFNEEKGCFSHYLNYKLRLSGIDQFNENTEKENREVSYDASEEETDNGEQKSAGKRQEERKEYEEWESREKQQQSQKAAEEMMSRLVVEIASFFALPNSQKKRKEKERWFRIFFTEGVTAASKEGIWVDNEKMAFHAANTEYLDYYMTEICRTMGQICKTALKTYRQLGIQTTKARMDREIPVGGEGKGFPAEVSVNFLKAQGFAASGSGRSDYLKKYYELLAVCRTKIGQTEKD